MRVPKSWIPVISSRIIDTLLNEELITPDIDREALQAACEEIIFEELSVEDRLNDEVREMLKQYESEIERGHMDYRRLFDLTKQKLIRERNIVV